jgi:hypothetical protein
MEREQNSRGIRDQRRVAHAPELPAEPAVERLAPLQIRNDQVHLAERVNVVHRRIVLRHRSESDHLKGARRSTRPGGVTFAHARPSEVGSPTVLLMFRVCESCGKWNEEVVVSHDGGAVCTHCGHQRPILRLPLSR